MNARVVALATILQIVVLVGLGIGLIFAPLTLMWAIDDSFATELSVYWATSVDVWLLGHGVPLAFTLSGELAESLSLGASNAEFVVDVALLGVGLVTVLWGYRMGRQDSTYAYPLLVWFLAVGTLVGLTLGMVAFLPEQVVQIIWLDALVRPALFLATGLAIAAWKTSGRTGMTALESLLPGSGFLIIRSGIAAGIGSVLAVIVVAAIAVAVLLVFSFAEVIGLYQALQPGLIGVVILSIGQLALLPTIIVWATTWFVGPGFSLGTGALVSPLGTNIQALPTVPILGIVPSDVPSGALAWILIPVVVAFVMGVLMAKTVAPAGKGGLWLSITETSFFQQPAVRLASAGVVAGFVAAGLGGLLADLTSGSLGPGRFQQVGPDPLMVALWWGLEVGFGVLLGALAAAATRTSTTATR
jgi:hypothetical protein